MSRTRFPLDDEGCSQHPGNTLAPFSLEPIPAAEASLPMRFYGTSGLHCGYTLPAITTEGPLTMRVENDVDVTVAVVLIGFDPGYPESSDAFGTSNSELPPGVKFADEVDQTLLSSFTRLALMPSIQTG
jgi:hypothetical protein